MSCKPPYKRGHGGYCGCDCKCLAPECWDLIYINYDCNEGSTLKPIGEGSILGPTLFCEENFKICPGINGASDYCQNENFPCIGYDCQIEGCVKSPYISGMYYTYSDCLNYCVNQEQKYLKLAPSEVFINGKICPNGTCPENPTWICCLDGIYCAATYADCPCSCIGKQGCTNPHSNNYDPDAKCDDGSCVTCCNAMKCVIDDRDDIANCNRLPLIDGFAGGTDGCCDAFCVEAGDCHPTFTKSHTVPAENSCSGVGFTYNACDVCTFTTTTTTTTTTPEPTSLPRVICYLCQGVDPYTGIGPIGEQCNPVDFTEGPCSKHNVPGYTYYSSEAECKAACETTTPYPYKFCYSCVETAIGGTCNRVPISYGNCSDYSVPGNTFYDSEAECKSNCYTTTTTTTTTTKPPCVVEVTTEGCCLEYSEGAIYAVGDGVVKAIPQDKENCCSDFRVSVNGKDESAPVTDGTEIEFLPRTFYCPCEETSIEPSDPSSASCPPKPAAKPMIVFDKKTNKIKILLNKDSLR
jgi:hypothetical protein